MTEDFLHFVWKNRLFDQCGLNTSTGEIIDILKPGEHNNDEGPDFFNARVRIGATVWAGNVEIHLKASDWKRHHHEKHPDYQNIILHIVYETDKVEQDGIPVLELKDLIHKGLWENYINLQKSNTWIPCEKQIGRVDTLVVGNWLDRVMTERLEQKSESILETLKRNKNNWEETFYLLFARNFGLKVNAVPFEILARSLPLMCLSKHKNQLLQLEAMFFGQAGLLNKTFKDDYPKQLQKEYRMLKQKFSLIPMEGHLWKFLRLRPSNFPTIRIAQFAQIIHQSSHLFSTILEAHRISTIKELLETHASAYWNDHYVFDKASPGKPKKLGQSTIENILINSVIPILFAYGIQKNNALYKERAVRFLEQLPAEKNATLRKWEEYGIFANSAFDTQALLQLRKTYCIPKKCLNCNIGNRIVNEYHE